jgi:hypothetical protein
MALARLLPGFASEKSMKTFFFKVNERFCCITRHSSLSPRRADAQSLFAELYESALGRLTQSSFSRAMMLAYDN